MSGTNLAEYHHLWLTALLILSGIKGCISAEASTPPICQKLLIPAYFTPGLLWEQMTTTNGAKVGFIVLNPASGVGSAPDASYQQVVDHAHKANIKVIGYVPTTYGTADQASLFQHITNYTRWYAVDGIFLDEVTIDMEYLGYYQALADQIHAAIPGGEVILNPGVVPNEAYMSIGDIVVIFEGSYSTYVSQIFPSWLTKYPSSKTAHLVYNTSQGNLNSAVQLAGQRYAGYLYVTNDVPPNPWNTLPSYWTNELSLVCASPPPTVIASLLHYAN